jgi:hypothetical protein
VSRYLLCTDLDRTLIPNGSAPEHPEARPRLSAILDAHPIALAFVTGRHRDLVEEAMRFHDLPRPDVVVSDVGTTIHDVEGKRWQLDVTWRDRLAAAWGPSMAERIRDALGDLDELDLQPLTRQAPFKHSYFTPMWTDPTAAAAEVVARLRGAGVDAQVVYSVDEAEGRGLLDLLPLAAGKRGAIEHLVRREGLPREAVLVAGDSGNDVDALVAGFPAVLVANASDEVRREVMRRAREVGTDDRIHLAGGTEHGMDGAYAAGIVEGIVRFWPELGVTYP